MADASPETVMNQLERDRLELYARASQGPTPPWYFPTLAVATAITIATFDLETPWATILAAFLMGAVIAGSKRGLENQAGFSPRISALPRNLRRGLYTYMIAHTLAVAVILIFAVTVMDSPWRFTIAGIACGLLLWLGATTVQTRYRIQARELAEREGIDLG